MTAPPNLNYFDGSGTTTSLVVTTNLFGLVLTGSVDPNVVDVQIDINGAGFVSDPSLVDLALPNFTVPNLSSFPDGLSLEKGQNVVRLRSVDISGGVSPVSTATLNVVAESDLKTLLAPPTGLSLQRRATSVDVSWSDLVTSNVTGYNVYASTGGGGTGSGYLRVNKDTIPSTSPTKTVVQEFPSSNVSYDLEDVSPQTNAFSGNDIRIVSQILDPVTNEVLSYATDNRYPLISQPRFRLTVSISALEETRLFTFNHDRNNGIVSGTLNSDTFAAVQSEDPLFYVVTAVFFDKSTGILQESRFSQELTGSPLPLDTTVRGIQIRQQDAVVNDYIKEIQSVQPALALIPASTVREVHIEPFGNEMQKAYFLLDFVHRAKSFAALLQIDDPGLTGTSIPVASSQYKQSLKAALSLSTDAAVQGLIDASFDSLAKNFSTPRLGRRAAVVTQTFYTTSKPTRDLVVAQDAVVSSSTVKSAPRFRAKGAVTLLASNAQSYFNQDTRRYEIHVQMFADVPGSVGNLPAGSIDTVVSGANGFRTTNEVASDFGRDVQSNLELAESAQNALSSLDTGTEGGYNKSSVSTPGVFETRIVKSGDPFMMRDYDEVRKKHIGGKVDIYVKGTLERTVQETFAFQFEMARSVRFDVIDVLTLTFRARDSRLTPNNPIVEMLFNPSQNLGLRNHSDLPTASYDLTGVTIVDYRTIRLSQAVPQPTTLLDDFVEGDYRFRSNNRFTPTVQPILRVSSVIGESSGALDPALGFTVFKIQDPLLEGESTAAKDYVTVNQVGGVPSGNFIPINDEQHVLIGEFVEPLDSVGVNSFTLAVFSKDRTIQYNGPDDPNPDYLVVGGSQTTPIKIVRTTLSNIASGATVSVDYQKDENFSVTYVVNDVLQQLQAKIRTMRHVTADVLVKQSLENPMSTEATVQLKPNADQATVDSAIRTSFTILTDSKGVGNAIHQSDVTAVIDDTVGVDFVVQPFSRLTLKDGAIRIRDEVLPESVFLPSLSKFSNAVYLLTQALPFNTSDGGGATNVHHGVFKDELVMAMASSLSSVGDSVNQAWIIGSQGAIIDGYSDDATLLPVVFVSSAIPAERIRRTANRVVISLNSGIVPADVPELHSFAATYVVTGDKGVKDIDTSQIEFLTPGDLTLTFRRAT